MIFTVDKNKRTLSRATSRAFSSDDYARREFTRERRDETRRTDGASAKFPAEKSPVDGLAGPGQFRIHSEMHSASFQSAARTETHNRRGRQLCRAQTAADYSAFTDYAIRAPSRRSVPAQYRGGVARIMTDGGDVINGGLPLFYRRGRDEVGRRPLPGETAAIRTDSKTPRCYLILKLSCKTLRFVQSPLAPSPPLCFYG